MLIDKVRAGSRALAVAACAASGIGGAAWGQTAPADATTGTPAQPLPVPAPDTGKAPQNASPQDATQIAEVVVTATKRKENLRNIPQSITAFKGSDLEKQGKLNLADYLEEAPGVTASQAANGQTRVTMRGINTDASPVSPLVSPVGVFIGDVPFTDSYIVSITPDLSAFDLKDVEILKGPQGTLFGGAALSGAIRYQLNDPLLGQWEARGFSQYIQPKDGGTAFTSGAALNIPVYSDKLALRVAYVDRHLPGTTDDTYSGARDVDKGGGNQVRAIALWQPLDSVKLKLTHLTQRFLAPDLEVPSSPSEHVNNLTITPDLVKNSFGMDALELGYDFYGMHFTSLSSRVSKHSSGHSDETFALIGPPPQGYPPALGAYADSLSNSTSFNQEIRLQSTGEGPLKWLVGAYYNKYKIHWAETIGTTLVQQTTGTDSLASTVASALGVPTDALANLNLLNGLSDSVSQERALFGDISYTLWHRLDLSAGLRLYRTQLDGGFLGSGLLIVAENGGNTDSTSTLKQQGVNPKFSAMYHFTRDISLYAAAAKGFRFGGINDFPATSSNHVPATYKSDTLWNYEMGLRTDWFDRTLRADLTVFYIRYKNPILAQTTPGLFGISYTDNVSAAVSRGIEPSLLWKTPLKGLSTFLSGDVMNAHITEPFQSATGQTIAAGTEMPGAAYFQFNGGIQYLRPIGFLLAGFNTNYTYVGKSFTDIEHTEPANGYGVWNGGFTFAAESIPGNPMLAINVSNILDVTKPTASAKINSIVTQEPVALYTLSPPRTISARLSLDF